MALRQSCFLEERASEVTWRSAALTLSLCSRMVFSSGSINGTVQTCSMERLGPVNERTPLGLRVSAIASDTRKSSVPPLSGGRNTEGNCEKGSCAPHREHYLHSVEIWRCTSGRQNHTT